MDKQQDKYESIKEDLSPRNIRQQFSASIFTPPSLIDMFRIQRDNDNLRKQIIQTEKNYEIIKVRLEKDLIQKSIENEYKDIEITELKEIIKSKTEKMVENEQLFKFIKNTNNLDHDEIRQNKLLEHSNFLEGKIDEYKERCNQIDEIEIYLKEVTQEKENHISEINSLKERIELLEKANSFNRGTQEQELMCKQTTLSADRDQTLSEKEEMIKENNELKEKINNLCHLIENVFEYK